MDIKTLQYWHKLEHFYPYILQEQKNKFISTYLFKDNSAFLDFDSPDIEYELCVRSYCVYLGIFKVESALVALEEGIGRNMKFRDCADDESCFCMFRLSSDGMFLPDSFQISSFPWAIHRVREGKIILDHWDEDFYSFQKEIIDILNTRKEPFDYAFLCYVRDCFAQLMNWKIDYSSNWLRIDMVTGREFNKEFLSNSDADTCEEIDEIQAENDITDEQIKKNDLLNSFYVRDLERVIDSVSQSGYSIPLKLYLEHDTKNKIDIENNFDVKLSLMSPENLPFGRWPSDYGARFMQQLDVNAFLTDDKEYAQQLFSVNGPPGTGKTTLLKDIIAAIVTKRANLLMKLGHPDDAFEHEKVGCITVGTYENYVWKLHKEFSQFGILVASSNNGAVENITHGLPMRKELPDKYDNDENKYFSEISDLLLGEEKTWALNAAALGNKSNRSKFAEALWPLDNDDEKYNFRKQLTIENKEFNICDWEEAKSKYQKKWSDVLCEYQKIEQIYNCVKEVIYLRKEIDTIKLNIASLEMIFNESQREYDKALYELSNADEKLTLIKKEIQELCQSTFLLRFRALFPSQNKTVLHYKAIKEELFVLITDTLPKLRNKKISCESKLQKNKLKLQENKKYFEETLKKIAIIESELELFKKETEMPLRVDEYFLHENYEDYNKSSPWGYKRLNVLREELFLEALQLHKSFVVGSRRMKDNLDGFSKVLRGRLREVEARMFTAPLLQSFFMMAPVVSTTFASSGSFLRNIPANEIAYLFIDEAGQAMPQAAAGSIWRSKKVIAVGDPLQIEPVVTLHDSVIEALGTYYEQNNLFTNKYTSVQTLSDFSNCLGGYRTITNKNDLWVGAPLVVHSRCQHKVFRIANKIAYDNKMIYATGNKQGAECKWIDIKGNSEDGHFVPDQANCAKPYVVQEFINYINEGDNTKPYPSLFIITPFRSVRAGLSRYFRKVLHEELINKGFNIDKTCISKWISNCIGTIHTFQGKEANTVILCLGVDSGGKGTGAVDWAGERPNILNVAVTRSKLNLYIIGDSVVWNKKAYFKTAYKICNEKE